MRLTLFFGLLVLLGACKGSKIEPKLFSSMPAHQTGIDFENNLPYDREYNPYTYRSFYNGGGVAVADVNGDSLPDVYFCGNRVPSRLYLNRGNFKFEDVTQAAGLWRDSVWTSGATFADVNGDGKMDLYVCKSGKPEGSYRHNELFLNNGDGTFSEKSAQWGLATLGLSVHAAFFDYDRDGDLDCYLLNNSLRPVGNYDFRSSLREVRDTFGGNKLFRNEGDHFIDVSAQAGIYSSNIGFGLGVTIGDINRDGWSDLFVSNDFFERDYLYINQKNGTFKEDIMAQMPELSLGSMGADMADLNNDGWPEVFVTEMLPETERRFKSKAKFDDWNQYLNYLRAGYHRQFPRNALHLNNGNGTFSEVSRLAGVSATDWSWGALIADLDNDGQRDLFVANGIYKDLLDQDYIQFASPYTASQLGRNDSNSVVRLIDSMPSEAIANYAFQNQGQLKFIDKAAIWGLDQPSFSNGSAYADFDNDGDLDLVVNNVNMPAFVYKNNAETLLPQRHWLQIRCKGETKNTAGLGATVTIQHQDKMWFAELAPMKGFQSTVDDRFHFGLDSIDKIERLIVDWPGGKQTILTQIPTNQLLYVDEKTASTPTFNTALLRVEKPIFNSITALLPVHYENEHNDFDSDRLLFYMRSYEGPKVAQGDVNGDGAIDIFMGNGLGLPGQLWLQSAKGFVASAQPAIADIAMADVVASCFFDADNDKDLDLYCCTGGSEFVPGHPALTDYIFLNNGKGQFTRSNGNLPDDKSRGSSVQAADLNGDGRQDLLVTTRSGTSYGQAGTISILINRGGANFENATAAWMPQQPFFGMVADVALADLNGDNQPDLTIVGQWMAPQILLNSNNKFTAIPSPKYAEGLYNKLIVNDLDKDGDFDLVLANFGENCRFKADTARPMALTCGDFDNNGSMEAIWSAFNGTAAYPILLRHDLVSQLPSLKKKFLLYSNYHSKTVGALIAGMPNKPLQTLQVHDTRTQVWRNDGFGKFTVLPLPMSAQRSSFYAISCADFNRDGQTDILLGGNFFQAKPEVGIQAGSYGTLLLGEGQCKFKETLPTTSGLLIRGAVRDFVSLENNRILALLNGAPAVLYKF